MKNLRRNPLFYVVLIIGIISACIITLQRVSLEKNDNHVAGSMEYSDILILSERSGLSIDDWLTPLVNSGMEYLILSPDNALNAEHILSQYGLKPVWLDNGDGFPENITEPELIIPEVNSDFSMDSINKDIPLGLIENNLRTGLNLPDSLENITAKELIDQGVTPVKVLYLYKGYRHMWNEEIGGDEIEALIFRAVTDRS